MFCRLSVLNQCWAGMRRPHANLFPIAAAGTWVTRVLPNNRLFDCRISSAFLEHHRLSIDILAAVKRGKLASASLII